MVNNRFSLKGWSLKTWVIKNKDSIKLLVSAFAGISAGFISNLPATQSAFAGTVIAAVSKLILDTIDYWQSE